MMNDSEIESLFGTSSDSSSDGSPQKRPFRGSGDSSDSSFAKPRKKRHRKDEGMCVYNTATTRGIFFFLASVVFIVVIVVIVVIVAYYSVVVLYHFVVLL